LKDALESEAYYLRDAGFLGANKRAISALAAYVWRHKRGARVDYGYRGQGGPFALEVATLTRAEYLESCED